MCKRPFLLQFSDVTMYCDFANNSEIIWGLSSITFLSIQREVLAFNFINPFFLTHPISDPNPNSFLLPSYYLKVTRVSSWGSCKGQTQLGCYTTTAGGTLSYRKSCRSRLPWPPAMSTPCARCWSRAILQTVAMPTAGPCFISLQQEARRDVSVFFWNMEVSCPERKIIWHLSISISTAGFSSSD